MDGTARKFNVTERASVPTGRNGKHKTITAQILDNLEGLSSGEALKIPLSELPDTKINIRSALSRASHKMGKAVGTAADDDYLYVWNL
ncbi:MAG TPA: hypothetical protein VG267_03095 [Terracidiphilus sp.]|jgi:hypothetical protein|nr:hypothetical protein [Terracidiphilus sp.]